ncbi:MAG: hypothetical protein HY870_08310 [Chloroflexi bacterium]|nr:hypothetical protein [Chloroflexota bacterium]
MRWRLFIGLSFFAVSMLACSLASTAQPAAAPPTTAVPPTPAPTMPPIAPATSSVPTFPTQPIISVATPGLPVTATGTLTATLSPTLTGTITATIEATTVPTAPPASTGPLDFQVYLVGCRLDSTRAGGVILTFEVQATGGNGVYTYIREGQVIARISDRPATKGTGVVDAWRVRSGDGQEIERKFQFKGSVFNCP